MFRYYLTSTAAAHGDLAELIAMHEDGYPLNIDIIEHAIFSGSIPVLEWLVQQGKTIESVAYLHATKYDKQHVLVWLYQTHPEVECHPDTFEYAAGFKHFHLIPFLHEQLGLPLSNTIMKHAAKFGNLQCLQYAHEHGCEWHPETTFNLAKCGNIQCLQYVLQNGCQWHPETSAEAGHYGHLNFLMYAIQHGCPWHHESTFYFASAINDLYRFCLIEGYDQYTIEGGESESDTNDSDESEGENQALNEQNNVSLYDDIYDQFDVEFDQQRESYTKQIQRRYDCLRYALRNGCPMNDELMESLMMSAAINDNVQLVQFLHEEFKLPLTLEIMKDSSDYENFKVFSYFIQTYKNIENCWDKVFNDFLDKIDIDQDITRWHRLFKIRSTLFPELKRKLQSSRYYTQLCIEFSTYISSHFVPQDIIDFCINKYF